MGSHPLNFTPLVHGLQNSSSTARTQLRLGNPYVATTSEIVDKMNGTGLPVRRLKLRESEEAVGTSYQQVV